MGVSAGKLDDLLARARRDVDDGILPSCQIAVGLGGEVIAFETFGAATPDTRYSVFSCTKPIVASTAWVLMGQGRIDVEAPVVSYVPEFGTNGKHVVTVEHLLLHTCGFPSETLMPPEWNTREGRLAAFAAWKLKWEPGRAFEYHPTSAHWVLAEVVERAAGCDYRDAVQRLVTDPAGFDRRVLGLGASHGDQDGIAPMEVWGSPATPDELEAAIGVRELPSTEITDAALLGFNLPEVRAAGVPGAGAVLRACDLALFYQRLLHDPDGIWHPAVLADGTGTVRNTFGDPLFSVPANRTRGLVQAGGDGLSFLRGFGSSVSARAFGHNGAGGQIAWADPESGLSFAYATNGLDANVIRQFRRGMSLSTRAGRLLDD
ncbi:MAG TPA: serine hydrolase domain-containing protein [Acidimicrobiales bacterium]|nr:serine hydrolase domain-containing protein [Acidimicrobiales bacterium]